MNCLDRIPTSFKLYAQTIEVFVREDEFKNLDDGHCGFASYRKNQIHIKPNENKEIMLNTFYHELVHFIMNFGGASIDKEAEYLHQDEGFVETVGNLLHQAFSTMEFDKHT